MNQSTTGRTEASKSFDDEPEPEPRDYTLAQAVEAARASRDDCFELRNEIAGELERIRAFLRRETKERSRKLGLEDWFLIAGLALVGIGIAVAFHWAYSLVVIGFAFLVLSVLPFTRRASPK